MSDFEIFPERFSFEERLWSVAEELVEREMAIDVVDGNSLFGDDDVVVAKHEIVDGGRHHDAPHVQRAGQTRIETILGRELVYKLFLSKGSLNQYNAKTMF